MGLQTANMHDGVNRNVPDVWLERTRGDVPIAHQNRLDFKSNQVYNPAYTKL